MIEVERFGMENQGSNPILNQRTLPPISPDPKDVDDSNNNQGKISKMPFIQAFQKFKNGGNDMNRNQFLQFMQNPQIISSLKNGTTTLNPLELSYMEINVGNDGNLSLDGNNDLFVGNDKDHPNNPTVNHLNIEKNGNVIRNGKSNNTNFTEGGSESRLVDYSLLQYPVVNDRRMSKAAKNNSSTDDSSAEEESMGIGIEMEVAKLTEEQKKEILNITRPPNQFFLYCEENRSILKKKKS